MANGQGSAGVTLREFEVTGPVGTPPPTGIPAGVIGTAEKGPAFVPVTVGSNESFRLKFGSYEGKRFGPLAVNEWMNNSGGRAATYLRVLGAGKGEERGEDGTVTSAGFYVGDQLPVEGGDFGLNPYATNTSDPVPSGSTYFIGANLIETVESSYLSSAGISKSADDWDVVGDSSANGVWVKGDADSSKVYSIYKNTFKYSSQLHKDVIGSDFLAETGDTILSIKAVSSHLLTTTPVFEPIWKFDLGGDDTFEAGPDGPGGAEGNGSASNGGNENAIGNFVIRCNKGQGGVKISQIVAAGQYNHTSGPLASFITLVGAPVAVSYPGGSNELVLWVNASKLKSWALEQQWVSHTLAPLASPVTLSDFKDETRTVLVPNNSDSSFAETLIPMDTAHSHSHPVVMGVIMTPNGVTASINSSTNVLFLDGVIGDVKPSYSLSFDVTDEGYFARILNSDPLKLQELGHCLYAHWDVHPALATVEEGGTFLVEGISDEGTPDFRDFRDRFAHAVSPWVVSQKFGGAASNLFRLHALDDGANISNKYKFSIENIVPGNPNIGDGYGTFDLLVRDWDDTDGTPSVIESFKALTLDPRSDKYIARVIGNSYRYFDFDRPESEQKLVDEIDHLPGSNIIRVEMDPAVDGGEIDPSALPMGFRGIGHVNTLGNIGGESEAGAVTPPLPMRVNIVEGQGPRLKVNSRLYWGAQFEHITDLDNLNVPPRGNNFRDASLLSFVKHFPSHRTDIANFMVSEGDDYCNNGFSLEKVMVKHDSAGKADYREWASARYSRDGSVPADLNPLTLADLSVPKNRRYGKFTFFMQGGFDGVNIFNIDTANLSNKAVTEEINNEARGRTEGPTFMAYKKAVDIMKNTVNGEIQLLAMPGLRNSSITEYAADAVRDRFDALYLMDIEQKATTLDSVGDPYDVSESDQDDAEGRRVSVTATIETFDERDMDNSFAAAYFPDVVINNPASGEAVTVPPSVVVLGAMALNDRLGHPWFAPAGVTRGALSSTVRTKIALSKSNLDSLYDAGINPLTPPSAGQAVTVWGQKTLQAGESALNRVNVRRLLIEIRRQVREIAQTIIFEPNRATTLARFTAAVTPRLQRIQALAGLERFRVVIDSSTTTQQDVENNTIRGKIFVQPTKTIEFVSLDFVVSNNGGEQV
jgi:hypothetical protein